MSLTDSLIEDHLTRLEDALPHFRDQSDELVAWGIRLGWALAHDGKLLVAGNGGSAAQAQHLAAELVGKLDADRMPLSAFALNTDTSALTAIANDYGYEEVFARQVRAHARPGDVVLLLSTSGGSPNVLAAADAAAKLDLETWALTGAAPNPLSERCARAITIASPDCQVIQELHLAAIHMLCAMVDAVLPTLSGMGSRVSPFSPDGEFASGNGRHPNGVKP